MAFEIVPWEYQENNINKALDFLSHGGKSLLLQQPTGTGKTLVASEIVTRFKTNSKIVYFVTHSKSLMWQFSDHLMSRELWHGLIAPGCSTLPNYKVQIISAGSLMTRIDRLPEPDLLIFEEAHHSTAKLFTRILDYWPHAQLIGLTATSNRPDGTPLSMYEEIITSPGVRWFIDNYFLADFDYYIPAEMNTSSLRTRKNGDFNQKDLEQLVENDKARIKRMTEYYTKWSNNLPGIAFGTSIADSIMISDRFNNAGFKMEPLHSKITGNIQEILGRVKTGCLPLISSCDMIGEGVDVKGLTAMIDGRPTDSLVIEIQHWGRVLRALYAGGHDLSTKAGRKAAIEEGGKGNAKILDFSSNYLRHGLPDDEREWSLKGIQKTSSESMYKRCPSCQRPVRKNLMTCNYCGYIFPESAAAPRVQEEIDGEMIPIGDLNPGLKSQLVRKIAPAKDFKEAVKIAKENGVNHAGAWYVWTRILHMPVKTLDKTAV